LLDPIHGWISLCTISLFSTSFLVLP